MSGSKSANLMGEMTVVRRRKACDRLEYGIEVPRTVLVVVLFHFAL